MRSGWQFQKITSHGYWIAILSAKHANHLPLSFQPEFNYLDAFFTITNSIAKRPTLRSNLAMRWYLSSLIVACSNSCEESSINSCFRRDTTGSLIPYSRLAWAVLINSLSISITTRALNSGKIFVAVPYGIPFLKSNSHLFSCPVFGVHYIQRGVDKPCFPHMELSKLALRTMPFQKRVKKPGWKRR